MKTLSIDIETYSEAELSRTGVYRYAEDSSFEILLFGYAVDGGDVHVVDIASGEKIPEDVLNALTDDAVTKTAFNANFERICLSRYLSDLGISPNPLSEKARFLNPNSWRCTMVWSAYLGLPLSLAGAGAVLGLEKQKLESGKDLIRYFCRPCAPTQSNGQRTRNLPKHAPEKWAEFITYNKRDVETEMEIQHRLAHYPVPEQVWDQYCLDQEINDRGILLDLTLVENAIRMDAQSHTELTEKMRELTQLDNPSSVQQMKRWLLENGLEVESLGKKQVAALLKDAPPLLRDVLSLRLQLARSSVRKYQAMQVAACSDRRARGMFQFYGANRTGRWCLTGDHEVLTPDGWIRLDQWSGGLIACWNKTGEAISFQKAEQLEFDYSGQVYTYRDNRIDQCSTPDHKMRIQRRYGEPWQDATVEEMQHSRPAIPLYGYRFHRGCCNPSWLRVLIMTQADGFYTADGSIGYNFKKQRKVERCKHLLRRADIPFVLHEYKGVTAIKVPARAVPLWLREFRTKTFGYWLLDENPDILFDELPHWDGYHPAPNSIQYSTCNKQNADIIQALAHMSGRCASIRIKKHSKLHENWQDAYVVDIWLTPGQGHIIAVKPTISEFKGKVYCAATQTGYFLVRRGGKVWVTGNSGRNVQLQNLPQNHLLDLEAARDLVRSGDYEGVKEMYGDVPDTLSQLVRTAFVAPKGKLFYVADFSAIEARVIAWLAGEQWRMDLFAAGGDIYCQSASKMFKCNVVKNGENGHLRVRGKISELACLAFDSKVLTDQGLVPIQDVTHDMKLWDGEEWVPHEGVIYKGEREVITYSGLTATPDHIVYVTENPNPVRLEDAVRCGFHLLQTGESGQTIGSGKKPYIASVYDIQNAGPRHRFTVSDVLVHNCGYGGGVGALKAMGAIEMGLSEDELLPLVQSWRAANPHIVQFWWDVDAAAMTAVREKTSAQTHGIRFTYKSGMLFVTLPSGRNLAYVKPAIGENQFGSPSLTYLGIGGTKKWERLETYGPKLTENITQAVARDILCYAMTNLRHCSIVAHVHDELIIEANPSMALKELCEQMSRTPPWAEGLILTANGYVTPFYKKD